MEDEKIVLDFVRRVVADHGIPVAVSVNVDRESSLRVFDVTYTGSDDREAHVGAITYSEKKLGFVTAPEWASWPNLCIEVGHPNAYEQVSKALQKMLESWKGFRKEMLKELGW